MKTQTLSLAKADQTFVFRFSPGHEANVVDEIIAMAEDKDSGLDWLDAAALGAQIAEAVMPQAGRHVRAAYRGLRSCTRIR